MLLVLCPLGKELKFLKSAMEALDYQFEPVVVNNLKCWLNDKFVLALGGHGKTQFAVQTEFLRNHFSATHLFLFGAAGSLTVENKTSDLIVATEVVEHDYKEKFNSNSALPKFQCDRGAIEIFKKYQGESCLRFAPIASGDEDIVSRWRANEIAEQTRAVAVAWEGAGGARVARFHGLPYTEIRVITDNACENAASDFHASLEMAMFGAGGLLDHYIRSI